MDELTAKLVLFSELGEESILSQLASVYRDWKQGAMSRAALAQRVHHQVKRLLDLATRYGFDENLWQDYLTFLLLTDGEFLLPDRGASRCVGWVHPPFCHGGSCGVPAAFLLGFCLL